MEIQRGFKTSCRAPFAGFTILREAFRILIFNLSSLMDRAQTSSARVCL